MRFLVAAALFILSIGLMLTGLGQRTIWAPPESVSIEVSFETSSPYVVVPAELLVSHVGTPNISISGADNIFAATGRESDILAWIGDSPYSLISEGEKALAVEDVFGVGKSISPVGSDLWRNEVVGEKSLKFAADPGDSGALLIASTGIDPAPGVLRITWPIANDLTLSNALIVAGLATLIAAFLVNLLAYQLMRRDRGPRRKTRQPPKPPQYRAKKRKPLAPPKGRRSSRNSMLAAPSAIIVLSLLSGCAPAEGIEPSPSPSASAADAPPAVVSEAQLARILNSVATDAAAADEVSDKKLLSTRFAGPALALRTTHYLLRSRSSSITALPAIVSKPITFSLPAASAVWPRSVMVVTDEDGDEALPQMLVLQQSSPRANYKLWYNVRLMPGAKIPEVSSPDVGAIPVEPDSLFLKLSPKDIPVAYGDLINNGQSSLSAGLFDVEVDEFYKQVSSSQKTQAQTLTTGKIVFTHALGEATVISLSTSEGGALVAVYMTDTYTIRPVRAGSAVAVAGQEKLLLGSSGSSRGVRSIYGDMLLFYVPSLADESQLRLLGVTQGLISVRSL